MLGAFPWKLPLKGKANSQRALRARKGLTHSCAGSLCGLILSWLSGLRWVELLFPAAQDQPNISPASSEHSAVRRHIRLMIDPESGLAHPPYFIVPLPSLCPQLFCIILSCFSFFKALVNIWNYLIHMFTYFLLSLLPQECKLHKKSHLVCLVLCYISDIRYLVYKVLGRHLIDACWVYTSVTFLNQSPQYEFDANCQKCPFPHPGNFSQRTFLVWHLSHLLLLTWWMDEF